MHEHAPSLPRVFIQEFDGAIEPAISDQCSGPRAAGAAAIPATGTATTAASAAPMPPRARRTKVRRAHGRSGTGGEIVGTSSSEGDGGVPSGGSSVVMVGRLAT